MGSESWPRFIITTGVAVLALVVSGVSLWFSLFPYEPESLALVRPALAERDCKLQFTPPTGSDPQAANPGKVALCWSAHIVNLGKARATIIETAASQPVFSKQRRSGIDYESWPSDDETQHDVVLPIDQPTTGVHKDWEVKPGGSQRILITVPVDIPPVVSTAVKEILATSAGKDLTLLDLDNYLFDKNSCVQQPCDFLGNVLPLDDTVSYIRSVEVAIRFTTSKDHSFSGIVYYPGFGKWVNDGMTPG